MELPQVAGRQLEMSIDAFEAAALVLLAEEQDEFSPDSALVGFLCEAVRLARQYADQPPQPRTHVLKSWPEFFTPLWGYIKTFEIRKDDRGFCAGDSLLIREWSPATGWTGRALSFTVTCLVSGFGLEPGYVCMSLERRRLAAFRMETFCNNYVPEEEG